MDDEYEFRLGNEDEFIPSTASTPGFEEDLVNIQFDRDSEDALCLSQKTFDNEDEKKSQYTTFVIQHKEKWADTTREGRNFLHYLALYDPLRKPNPLTWLMMRAILYLPRLMGAMDKSKRTPLTVALSIRNYAFVHATCMNQSCEVLQIIGAALASECETHSSDHEVTCLHAALVCDFDSDQVREERIKTICSFVPEEMFTVVDNKGRTPLHLAVEYEWGCKSQVSIVEELLRRAPQALNVDMFEQSGKPISVYQHHKNSKLRDKCNQEDGKEEQDRNPKPRDSRADGNQTVSESKERGVWFPPLPGDEGKLSGRKIKRKISMQMATIPQGGETQRPTLDVCEVGSSVTGASPLTGGQKGIDLLEEREKERGQAAKLIGEQLKLLYLRTQKPDRASQCLHLQDGKDKELWFDFGLPKKLTKVDIKKQFDHLLFESALQYVAFLRIELDEDCDVTDKRLGSRTGIHFFFDWLRQKGVKRIITVIVDDLKGPSHSDQAIENALKPLDIEILDWRRLDLDPTSLAKIGKCLREIHLQWSGRNTVLRSWSEKEGLAMIPTLEVIHIIQVEGWESDTRIRENLDHFERRLHESWPSDRPKPRVNPSVGPLDTHPKTTDFQSSQHHGRSVDPHRWMQCMDEFASNFRQIRHLESDTRHPRLNPVEVALIDDGADLNHPDLKGMKSHGKSFHHYPDGPTWRVSPYWDSASSHGTLMARLIHRVCPSAVIHIIKLETFKAEASTKIQINPDSAISAIEYASKQGVGIISMSWTIKPPKDPAKKKAFDDAIHFALNTKGILLFCAASDQGKSADLTYPHSSNPNSFRIGAAKSTGSILDTVGDSHELSFIFPGHEVVFDHTDDDTYGKEFQKFEARTGSSVATALAAGLAALIIECVRMGALYSVDMPNFDPAVKILVEDTEKIQEREKMQYALMCIGTSRNTDSKYIEVWDTFCTVAENLKRNEGEPTVQLEIIAGLARMFLRKGVPE